MIRAILFLLFSLQALGATSLSASLKEKILDAAHRSYLDPRLVEAIVLVESNANEKAESKKGAIGLMQVMPRTARSCGIKNAYHAVDNLMGACECLRKLMNRFPHDIELALAAYNAGIGKVLVHKGIPPFEETQNYVRKVLKIYNRLKG